MNLLEWSAPLFDWQQGALRRLALNLDLSDEDRAAIMARTLDMRTGSTLAMMSPASHSAPTMYGPKATIPIGLYCSGLGLFRT